jgi:hypothetical protein
VLVLLCRGLVRRDHRPMLACVLTTRHRIRQSRRCSMPFQRLFADRSETSRPVK